MAITFKPIYLDLADKFEKRFTALNNKMKDMLNLVLDSDESNPLSDEQRGKLMQGINDIISDESKKIGPAYIVMLNRIMRLCNPHALT